MKKYVCGLLIMLASYSVSAEMRIGFLMNCQISEVNSEDRIIFTSISDDLFQNGQEHFAVWNTYGDVNVDRDDNLNYSPENFGIIGHTLVRMNSSRLADDYELFRDGRDYIYEASYADGSFVRISFIYEGLRDGLDSFGMFIEGEGEQHDYLLYQYDQNLASSEQYNPDESIICTEGEDL